MNARPTLFAAGLLMCALVSSPIRAEARRSKPVQVSTQIARWATWTQRSLMSARQERDVVRALCLNDRLNELHALERTARRHEANLSSSVLRHARRARLGLRLSFDEARDVFKGARDCLGARPAYVSGTQVRFWVDPRVAPYEPRYPDASLRPKTSAY